MADTPYERFAREELILRDELAIDRTLLAYLRSAMALGIVGITFLHFGDVGVLHYFGIAFVPLGVLVAIVGSVRYRTKDEAIRAVRARLDRRPPTDADSSARNEGTP